MAETSRQSLPEGNRGIAVKYPGDAGIEKDSSVVFVEKFDSDSVDDVAQRWDSVQNLDIMSLSSDVPEGSADGKSLLMTHVGGKSTGGHLYRRLLPGYKQLFVRFYVKFHPNCAQIHHFGPHIGGYNPPTLWPQGSAGTRPRGDDRFSTHVEPFGERRLRRANGSVSKS